MIYDKALSLTLLNGISYEDKCVAAALKGGGVCSVFRDVEPWSNR